MDSEEQLAAIRARLIPEPPPYPDLRTDLAAAQDEIDRLNHRVKSREFENSSLYRRIERLETELQAERMKGAATNAEFSSC